MSLTSAVPDAVPFVVYNSCPVAASLPVKNNELPIPDKISNSFLVMSETVPPGVPSLLQSTSPEIKKSMLLNSVNVENPSVKPLRKKTVPDSVPLVRSRESLEVKNTKSPALKKFELPLGISVTTVGCACAVIPRVNRITVACKSIRTFCFMRDH
jgi:hypothetical protein